LINCARDLSRYSKWIFAMWTRISCTCLHQFNLWVLAADDQQWCVHCISQILYIRRSNRINIITFDFVISSTFVFNRWLCKLILEQTLLRIHTEKLDFKKLKFYQNRIVCERERERLPKVHNLFVLLKFNSWNIQITSSFIIPLRKHFKYIFNTKLYKFTGQKDKSFNSDWCRSLLYMLKCNLKKHSGM